MNVPPPFSAVTAGSGPTPLLGICKGLRPRQLTSLLWARSLTRAAPLLPPH